MGWAITGQGGTLVRYRKGPTTTCGDDLRDAFEDVFVGRGPVPVRTLPSSSDLMVGWPGVDDSGQRLPAIRAGELHHVPGRVFGAGSTADDCVFAVRDRLKMFWVHARRVATEVVDDHACRDGTDHEFVGDTVSNEVGMPPVSVPVFGADPFPARAGNAAHPGPERSLEVVSIHAELNPPGVARPTGWVQQPVGRSTGYQRWASLNPTSRTYRMRSAFQGGLDPVPLHLVAQVGGTPPRGTGSARGWCGSSPEPAAGAILAWSGDEARHAQRDGRHHRRVIAPLDRASAEGQQHPRPIGLYDAALFVIRPGANGATQGGRGYPSRHAACLPPAAACLARDARWDRFRVSFPARWARS